MTASDIDRLLAPYTAEVQRVARGLRELVQRAVPDTVEELDESAKLIAFSFQPGTYTGLIVAIAPQTAHVNLMFSKGVELMELDTTGLLEGTGKNARHIKFHGPQHLDDPQVASLVAAAAERTPRS